VDSGPYTLAPVHDTSGDDEAGRLVRAARREGRTGQVALRERCGEGDKIYVHITNRPALREGARRVRGFKTPVPPGRQIIPGHESGF